MLHKIFHDLLGRLEIIKHCDIYVQSNVTILLSWCNFCLYEQLVRHTGVCRVSLELAVNLLQKREIQLLHKNKG